MFVESHGFFFTVHTFKKEKKESSLSRHSNFSSNVETDLQGITQQKMIDCLNNYLDKCVSKSKIVRRR